MTPRRIMGLVLLAGCSGGDPALASCEAIASCRRGPTIQECLDDWTYWDDWAEDMGCEKRLDQLQTCIAKEGECAGGELEAYPACLEDWKAFTGCLGGTWDYYSTSR